MAIERGGQWWRGTEAADIDEYLKAYSADSYPVTEVVRARCANCGSQVFAVRLDDEQGYADRRCRRCGRLDLMLDSADVQDEAEIGEAACPCGGEEFEVGVGFAFFDDGDVRWIYVGLRCVADGVLGVYTDWKIDYSPSAQLLAKV